MLEQHQQKFLPTYASFKKQILGFSENNFWKKSPEWREKEKVLIWVTYKDTIFNVKNKKRKI